MPPRESGNETKAQEGVAPGFEVSLRALEQAVASLEAGGLDLDAALKSYEEGVRLLARCHGMLEAAEQKVRILTGSGEDGTPRLEPFAGASEGEEASAS